MKKLMLTGLAALVMLLAANLSGFAQKAMRPIVYGAEMAGSLDGTGVNFTEISMKAMRHFKKAFDDVEGEKWFKFRTGYMASFMKNGIRFRVEYDNKGNWTGTEKGYEEGKLQRTIRERIKGAYFDYDIKWVKQVTLPDLAEPVYLVLIEDDKNIKNISLHDGELKTLNQYYKQSSLAKKM